MSLNKGNSIPTSVPVLDLFAGPGGLGEGFARQTEVRFDIAISIEKDEMAHETLRLRSAHRALTRGCRASPATWAIWDSIVQTRPWNVVFYELRDCGDPLIQGACVHAAREALNLELGPKNRAEASQSIRERLGPYMTGSALPHNSVLIGGPPCQAYSIVGRSRNKGTVGYKAEADHRHFLYLEYLHVIAEFQPAVFVMENVKGILTSRVQDTRIFHTIQQDLKRPDLATGSKHPVEYVLAALPPTDNLIDDPSPADFIVKAEEHGVPQARHRVVILGIRKDVAEQAGVIGKLRRSAPPSVWDVIRDLPGLRPQLSHRGKGMDWLQALEAPLFDTAVSELRRSRGASAVSVADRMLDIRSRLRDRVSDPGAGADRIRRSAAQVERKPRQLADWFGDRPSELLTNHECRAHMPSDLVRYLFAATFGQVTGESPRLIDFPRCLLPSHKNVDPDKVEDSIFKDRFRVQIAGRHSMTVTSHIAKDGHAFIHPKPMQCRSLTVREAARLQTFPDSYVFLGNRTAQYTQVGNAVPPYLANQIAEIVARVLKRAQLA
jgi:DNA (cytosine-5)-methyltransferase 1